MSENNPIRLELIVFFILGIVFVLWSFKQCGSDKTYGPNEKTRSTKKRKRISNNEKYATLYVTADSLNMRVAPHLDSIIIARLPRTEAVAFYGLRTSFRQKININNTIKNEPWVYIRAKTGRQGWVYAGGLTFYKIK